MSHPKVLIFFANIFPYWEEELAIAQDTGGEGGGELTRNIAVGAASQLR